MTSVTARGRARREQLLEATAALVAERGFHAVGIADIGAAAGVTGAAIYRHFASKEEMLAELYDRVLDGLLDGARAAAEGRDPLDALVRRHVEFALDERALIKVWSREANNLPDDDRRRFRRKQRAYAEIWTDAVLAERPGLDRPVARAAVHAVFGLLNSVADYDARLQRDDLAALLRRSALSVVRSC